LAAITPDVQNQISQEVSKIVPLLESTLLVDDGIQIVEGENKKEGYEFCDKVTIHSEEKDEIYYLYYNKTETIEKDEDEKEIETFYEGEMVFDTLTYRFTMEGEIEEDDNEIEKESTFILYTEEGKEIITSREIKNGEEEFSYKVKENGEEVFEVSIEIEEKKGKIETKVEYENDAKDIEFEYIFSKERDEQGEYYLLKGIQKEETNHSIRIRKNGSGKFEMTFYDANNEKPLNE